MRTPIATAAVAVAAVLLWRNDRRIASAFVNSVVNPWALRHGLAGGRHSEIGSLEHIGRQSGTRRVTLIHPVATPDGFRVIVPLGAQSEWVRNVLAAGHCRLQLHERIYELDEPRLITVGELTDGPRLVRSVMDALDFRCVMLHTLRQAPGTFGPRRWPPARRCCDRRRPRRHEDDRRPTTRSWADLPSSAKAFRLAHAGWGVVNLASLGYVWSSALRRRRSGTLVASVVLLSVEGLALVVGRGDCPFGPFQARLGDPGPDVRAGPATARSEGCRAGAGHGDAHRLRRCGHPWC